MIDSLQNILAGRVPEEPAEVRAIKEYVMAEFGKPVKVSLQNDAIVVTAPSAAFAASLRMRTVQIGRAAGTEKRLVFRIG